MTLFRSGHAQENPFAFFVGLSFGEIAVGLRGLDFRLPVAHCSIDRLLMIFLLRGHAALKRKELQTAQQKLSERQRRGIHVKAWGNAPGLRKSETSRVKAGFRWGRGVGLSALRH